MSSEVPRDDHRRTRAGGAGWIGVSVMVTSPRTAPARRSRPPEVPAAHVAVERFTLPNGLRVVLSPDPSVPAVGVAVAYDVGMRSEPEGRTGFAHLFEHLMFEGSENVGKMQHAHLVQSAGGVMNGSTHPDYTNYFEVLPSGALELALFLEADRMRAPTLSQETLDNQISVVKEEIRVNVLNQPYGGFPWIPLPELAFDTFANRHNGYGDFVDLDGATLADAQQFFADYYAPANAVLSVAGDLDVAATREMVERLFDPVPRRAVPERPSFAEPSLTAPRHGVVTDRHAPQPALALAWRTPDPVDDLDDFLAPIVLAEVLTDGDASRLQRRLLLEDRSVTSLSGYLGAFGDPFDGRDPVLLTLEVLHPETTSAEQVADTVAEELARLTRDGLPGEELARVQAHLAATLLRMGDSLVGRVNALAVLEQQHGRAELVGELPGRLAAVPVEQVLAAAALLTPDTRVMLELQPVDAA